MLNQRTKTILTHLIVIIVVITYEVGWASYFKSAAGFWDYLFFYALHISFFYFNTYVVVGRNLRKERFMIRLVAIVILEFLVYCGIFIAIAAVLSYAKTGGLEEKNFKLETEFRRAIYRGSMFLIYSLLFSFARYRITLIEETIELKFLNAESEKKRVELENKMLLAENALLESQIKTHLLFNTLSYVYDKTMDLPGGPGEAVLILNDVMRYSLKKVPTDGKMPINEEIAHIRNIVRLGELRHDEGLFIEIETENVDNPEYRIIASMLSTFIENMFKYGDLKDPITPATVSAKVEGNTFSFRATNKKTARSGQESHKIGLDNVRRRLQYAYDSFSLIVTDNPDEFIIELKVPV